MPTLYHDYETYCDLDIKEVGVYRYAEHPSLEVLMLAYAFDDGPVKQWLPSEGPMPRELFEAFMDPSVILRGFNVQFERLVTKYALGLTIPVERYRCTMVEAYCLAFTGNLGEVGAQLGVAEEHLKMSSGKKLIQRFCKPTPKNYKVRRHTEETSPEEWVQFKRYNIGDVVAEREIHRAIRDYESVPEIEWRMWFLDQRINDKGLPVDRELCEAALAMHAKTKSKLIDEMRKITKLNNPNSGPQLKTWLSANGLDLPDLQAGTLDHALEFAPDVREDVARVIYLKRLVGMTAPTKWGSYLDKLSDDDFLRGAFQFAGASRTWRWASRGVNLQNLKRPPDDIDMDFAAEAILRGNPDEVSVLFDEPVEFLAYTVRAGICAPTDMLLPVADLSSIESRVVGWLTNCAFINDTFAQGRDTYKKMATSIFGVTYDQVTKPQRKFAKPVVLAGPYGQGGRGLVGYAAGMGVVLSEEEATSHVKAFRSSCYEIPQFWRWLEAAVQSATVSFESVQGYKLRVYREKDFVFIALPSGRRLAYYKPEMKMRETPWGEMKAQFTYMGQNQDTRQWVRLQAHAGLLTENIVQAIARDVLRDAMLSSGLDIRGHVHDEIIALSTAQRADEDLGQLINTMSRSPSWAPDMLLGAAGFTTKHYRKD